MMNTHTDFTRVVIELTLTVIALGICIGLGV